MKGVYACSYLHLLEKHFKVELHNHFDLVAGTSTGGIIALGIGAGISAGGIAAFYQEHGRTVFRKSYSTLGLVALAMCRGSAHNSTGLQTALSGVFMHKDGTAMRMKDSLTRLCIPAVKTTDCKPRVFKAVSPGDPHSKELNADLETTFVDVALATSAAPLYLPSHQMLEGHAKNCYVDGGLWANNPAMVGYVEAKTITAQRPQDFNGVHVLSVALPGFVSRPLPRTQPKSHRLVQGLLEQTMESGKSSVDYELRILSKCFPNDFYFRVEPSPIGKELQELLRLDNASDKAIRELLSLGKNDAEHHKRGLIKTLFPLSLE